MKRGWQVTQQPEKRVLVREAGYSFIDMRRAGVSCGNLLGIASMRTLKDAGYTVAEMKESSTLDQIMATGYTAGALKDFGYRSMDLKAGGYTAGQMRAGGYTSGEMKSGGYSAGAMKAGGYTLTELKAGG